MTERDSWLILLCSVVFLCAMTQSPAAQQGSPPRPQPPPPPAATQLQPEAPSSGTESPDFEAQLEELSHAVKRLPLAAALACVLALRPRRKGTPPRQASVIQTQIILAVVGAAVMLVVGSSLARAFGIVGAAGLVRYRAKIADPKDAGVLLSTLAVGVASGVGLWFLAIFVTAFILGLLWIVESFEPKVKNIFLLDVKSKDPAALKVKLEQLFKKHGIGFELRQTSADEISYEVELGQNQKTDRLTNIILGLDPDPDTSVKWDEKKAKK